MSDGSKVSRDIIVQTVSAFGSAFATALKSDNSFVGRNLPKITHDVRNEASRTEDALAILAHEADPSLDKTCLPWLAQLYAERKFAWRHIPLIRSLLVAYRLTDINFSHLPTFSSIASLAHQIYNSQNNLPSLRPDMTQINRQLRTDLQEHLDTSSFPRGRSLLTRLGTETFVSCLSAEATLSNANLLRSDARATFDLMDMWEENTAWSTLKLSLSSPGKATSQFSGSRHVCYFLLPDGRRLKLTALHILADERFSFDQFPATPILLDEQGHSVELSVLADLFPELRRRAPIVARLIEQYIDPHFVPTCLQTSDLVDASFRILPNLGLRDLAPHLLNDTHYMEFVRKYPTRIFNIPSGVLERNPTLVQQAVQGDGLLLREIPTQLRTTSVCHDAVTNTGLALEYVPAHCKTAEICHAAVQNNGLALAFVPSDRITYELCLDAVHQTGHAFTQIPPEFRSSILCLLAVQKHPENLALIPESQRSPELLDAWSMAQKTNVTSDRDHRARRPLLDYPEPSAAAPKPRRIPDEFNAQEHTERSFWDWQPYADPTLDKTALRYPGSDGFAPVNILRAHPDLAKLQPLPDWASACETSLAGISDAAQILSILHDHGICAEPRGCDLATREPHSALAFLGCHDHKGRGAWVASRALPLMPAEPRLAFLRSWGERNGSVIWLPLRLGDLHASPETKRFSLPIHMKTLSEFLRSSTPRVIAEQNFGNFERSVIAAIPNRLAEAACWTPQLDWAAPKGFRFFSSAPYATSSTILIRELATGNIVAGVSGGTTWVDPAKRGFGFGRLLVEYGDLYGCLAPSHFSVDGFRARLSAHRHALKAALSRGEKIDNRVLADYTLTDDGDLRLSNPKWHRIIANALEAPAGSSFGKNGRMDFWPYQTGRASQFPRSRTKRAEKKRLGKKGAESFSLEVADDSVWSQDELWKEDYDEFFDALREPLTLDPLQGTPVPQPMYDSIRPSVKDTHPMPNISSKPPTLAGSAFENQLEPMRQPDGISCGATAVSMVLNSLRLLPKGGIADIKRLIRTNPITGTIPWAVLEGLKNIGVNAAHHTPLETIRSPEAYLRRLLEHNGPNFVMLRLLIGAMGKHWIVAEKTPDGNGVRFIDPASGNVSLLGERPSASSWIFDAWQHRDYEAITVSRLPSAHMGQLPPRSEDILEANSGMVSPELQSLNGWLLNGGAPTLVSDDSYAQQHAALFEDFPVRIRKLAKDPYLHQISAPGVLNTDARFYLVGGPGKLESLLVAVDNSPVAALINGVSYVTPTARRRGLGSDMLLAAASNPYFRFLEATEYSVAGYRTRLSAHRRAVNNALALSGMLPPLADADYAISSGGAFLKGTYWQDLANQANTSDAPISLECLTNTAEVIDTPKSPSL